MGAADRASRSARRTWHTTTLTASSSAHRSPPMRLGKARRAGETRRRPTYRTWTSWPRSGPRRASSCSCVMGGTSLSRSCACRSAPTTPGRRRGRGSTPSSSGRRRSSGIRSGCSPLRYEDLVADPGNHVARVCAFLGLDYDPEMLAIEQTDTCQDRPGSVRLVHQRLGRNQHDGGGQVAPRDDAGVK